MTTVTCTRITGDTQITTNPCFYFGCKAPVKTSGAFSIYNEGSSSKTAALKVVPSYDNSSTAVNDVLPFGIRCSNGLYVDVTNADEVYIYWA